MIYYDKNKIIKIYFYIFCYLFFFLFLSTEVFSKIIKKNKNKLYIIHADFIQNYKLNKFIISGNVHIKYDKYHIFCKKLIYDKSNNKFFGYGKIKVKLNNLKLSSNYVEYYKKNNVSQLKFIGDTLLKYNKIKLISNKINFFIKSKRFQAIKSVLFIDKLKLITNKFEYNFLSKRLICNNQGTIFYKNYIIHSNKGYFLPEKGKIELKYGIKFIDKNQKKYLIYTKKLDFFTKKEIIIFKSFNLLYRSNKKNFLYSDNVLLNLKKKIFLFKNINLRYKNTYIKCKSLFFNNRINNGSFKKIILNNLKKDYLIYGNNGLFSFNKKNVNVTINNSKIVINNIKNYTIFIYSKYLKTIFNNNFSNYSIKSFNNKIIVPNQNISAYCYLLKFIKNNIRLLKNIIIKKDNDKQLFGDDININLINKEIKDITIKNIFFSKKNNSKEFNQIKGDVMVGIFKKNFVKKISISGNVNGIIFLPLGEEKLLNKFYTKKLLLYIENNKIKNIDFFDKKNYNFLFFKNDNNLPKESIFLPEFKWMEK
ncbi:hypothetical protein [Blattabacterium cuenoti]|uniref:hypothetical protein n=1 Tax=Blattabacterium cuenoti TaxID=1653831 RepID=UPI00163CE756|nr:hypothetical protein [Blattabacterium cuenoti]